MAASAVLHRLVTTDQSSANVRDPLLSSRTGRDANIDTNYYILHVPGPTVDSWALDATVGTCRADRAAVL